MTKILFIGDIHGKPRSPLDRLCDYNEDLFKKLEWIRDYCITNKIMTIVHLGDIYDKPEATDEWKNKFIQIWKSYPGTFYSIIGKAHDLFYNNEQSYSKTCLYNLELSGVIKVLTSQLKIDDIVLYPLSMHVSEAKRQLQTINDMQIGYNYIFLAHQFYNWDFDPDAGINDIDIKDVPYSSSLILGHDHRQHETLTVSNCQIFRPGSLMRTELSETTIKQRPRVLVYDNYSWSYVSVPCRDINEIYDVAGYRSRKATVKAFKQVKNGLDNMSTYFHQDDVVVSCSEALKELNCPQEEFYYLKSVYQLCSQQF